MSFDVRFLISCGVCFVCFVGCGQQDEITRYSIIVPVAPSGGDALHGGHGHEISGNSRMLAAIVPQGSQTWFFKVTGPDDSVEKEQDRFAAFVKSVRFSKDAKQPEWDLPEGWKQLSGSGMRFATIEIAAADRPLELTVIPLATQGDDYDAYVLANINRWRGQLGIAPIDSVRPKDDVPSSDVAQFKLADGTNVTVVNLLGQLGAMAAAPGSASQFAIANHPPISGAFLDGGSASPKSGVQLKYKVPDGWTEVKAGGLRHAAFEVTDGDQKAEITVIDLDASAGDRLANINRWRQQVHLADTTDKQLAADLKKIPVGEHTGDYVELVGPEDKTPRESILGAIVDVDGKTWFIKFKGNSDLAARERDRFKTFARSLTLAEKTNNGEDDDQ